MNSITRIASGAAAVFLHTVRINAFANNAARIALGDTGEEGDPGVRACTPTGLPCHFPLRRERAPAKLS